MVERAALPSLAAAQAKFLQLGALPVDGERLLLALCGVESSFGKTCGLRVEPAYSPGGLYYKKSPAIRAAYWQYGHAACGSWGPWQLLYPTACELGFVGLPWDLFGGEALPWTVKLINARILPKINGDEQIAIGLIADGYNSGNPRDANVPDEYIQKVTAYYNRPLADLQAEFSA